jgi:urease accessory protein
MSAVLAMLLADGRTPSGGHAHSGGLEPALAAGPTAVPELIAARLRTVARVEAVAAVLAAAAPDVGRLLDLEAEIAARTPSEAARDASRRLGLSLLRTARRLWPDAALLREYEAATVVTARPVVLGAAGAAAGLGPVDVATLSLYEDAATVAAAAPKLLPLDPADAAAWLAAAAPAIELEAPRAVAAAALGTLPATATPLLDLRAEHHRHDTRRLFAS